MKWVEIILNWLAALLSREASRKAVDQRVEKADEIERRIDAAGESERVQLRNKWTRAQ